GTIIKDGNPEEVMDFYNALIAEKEGTSVTVQHLDNGRVQTRSDSGEASILAVDVFNSAEQPAEFIRVGEIASLRIKVGVSVALPELVVGYMIKDRLGQSVYGTNTHHLGCKLEALEADTEIEYRFTFAMNLGVGSYSIAVALHTADTHLVQNYEWRDLAAVFNVVNMDREEFVGLTWMPPEVELVR
uniref:Wzt carbohydrate-binding domain-containing protein n=1 Tax=uncultured Pseudomonas sp. TaxID=114707 RepID=UPI00258447E4